MRGLERIGQQQAAAEATNSWSFLDEFQTSTNEIWGQYIVVIHPKNPFGRSRVDGPQSCPL
jgi:hypothetical protein